MSSNREMLADAAEKLFSGAAAGAELEGDGWCGSLWRNIDESGFPLTMLTEEQGGAGGDWEDAFAIAYAAGFHAIPLPVTEAILATKLAADAGFKIPSGPSTIAATCDGQLRVEHGVASFGGILPRVPWGRYAEEILTVAQFQGHGYVCLFKRRDATLIQNYTNIAGEPRDTLSFRDVRIEAKRSDSVEVRNLCAFGALLRVGQISGALESALHRTIEYAKQRKQFGRPIGQFQAVQQQLALFGAETAAVSCAGRAASRAAAKLGAESLNAIISAKLRANCAIGLATATAHQVHAAIGFTWEYALRQHTQRLWAWRSEFGNDQYWASRLGDSICQRGVANFWPDLTMLDDRACLE